MWGVITHVSNLNISTACTNAFKNIPDNHRFSPSHSKIIKNLAHFILIFLRSPTTTRQSSYKVSKIRPVYLNDVTKFRGGP